MTDRPVADREPLSDKLENDLRELWAATPAEFAKRLIRRGWRAHPDEAGLREALERALGSLPEEAIRQEYEPGSTHEGGPTLYVEWTALLAALATTQPERRDGA